MKFGRRRLLQGVSATSALASVPWLSQIGSAQQTFPLRFVTFFTASDAVRMQYWKPEGSGQEYPLTTLNTLMTPLEPFKDKLTIVGDMQMLQREKDQSGEGHRAMGFIFTGWHNVYGGDGDGGNPDWAGGISLDHHVANHLGVTPLTLAADPGPARVSFRISYRDRNEPDHPFESPEDAFERVFGGNAPGAEAQRAREMQRRSVLDLVSQDVMRLQRNGNLPADDRLKLDRHLTAVRELEQRIGQGPVGAGGCVEPVIEGRQDWNANDAFPEAGRRHADVLAQALACGITRVGSLQLGDTGGNNYPTWPDYGVNLNQREHQLSHEFYQSPNDTTTRHRLDLERFYYSQFAYFLEQLDAIPEGDGTLLDNTVVLLGKSLGWAHRTREMPFTIAGGKNAGLRTGRYLDAGGTSHNRLLLSCAHLMGTDDSVFGDPDYCPSPFPL